MSPAVATPTAAALASASQVATTAARLTPLLLLLLLQSTALAATTGTTSEAASSTAAPTTTALPGVRIRCYVCNPCSLDHSVSAANANNQSVCEQCGKSILGYLGTVTRISRQCYRREDASYAQCSPSSGSDAKQLCCANGDYCNRSSRLATESPWLTLLLLVAAALLLPWATEK